MTTAIEWINTGIAVFIMGNVLYVTYCLGCVKTEVKNLKGRVSRLNGIESNDNEEAKDEH